MIELILVAAIGATPHAGVQPQDPPATEAADPEFIDVFKIHEDDYAKPEEPTIIEIAPATYLAIEGSGAPEGEMFQQRIGALYGAAFALKNACAKEHGFHFGVGLFEAQWWADEKYGSFLNAPRDEWQWRLMMRVPQRVTEEQLKQVIDQRAPADDADHPLRQIKLKVIEEGVCVQMLHKGPYADERPNIEWMHKFLEEQGYEMRGKHREIYLNNPQSVPPKDLRTILRQPVKKRGEDTENP